MDLSSRQSTAPSFKQIAKNQYRKKTIIKIVSVTILVSGLMVAAAATILQIAYGLELITYKLSAIK